jgi:hypothetical protein
VGTTDTSTGFRKVQTLCRNSQFIEVCKFKFHYPVIEGVDLATVSAKCDNSWRRAARGDCRDGPHFGGRDGRPKLNQALPAAAKLDESGSMALFRLGLIRT